MIESYSIEIPNEKAGTYQSIALIICVINFFAFAYAASSRAGDVSSNSLIFFAMALSLAAMIRFGIHHFKKKPERFPLEFFLIPCGLIWLITGATLPGLLLIALSILGIIAIKKKVIHFNADGITYPSFPAKLFIWNEIDFVMLKDDILTIETKANRVLQFTLGETVSSQVSVPDFNAFCTKCITEKQP